jgi:hypothetical protein
MLFYTASAAKVGQCREGKLKGYRMKVKYNDIFDAGLKGYC